MPDSISNVTILPKVELLAPAGNWECVRAAVANGADAVYFGLPKFNARMRADNFTEEDLPKVVSYLHQYGVKAFVAFNVLVFSDELAAAEDQLRLLAAADVDAVIIQDLGLAKLAAVVAPSLAVHASTQMTLTSAEGIAFARQLGIKRAVLARELSLREIHKLRDTQMPLEVFVHGALCVAYSGQCLTSEALGQRSANRGECAQACRMPYELIVDGKKKDLGDRKYLLSPQDLAAVDTIPQLIEHGVVSFKIEGRLKTPEYVAAICQVYRRAIDNALAGRLTPVSAEDRYKMEMAFSRGLFTGWVHGVNHQKLVKARFGKKRGAFIGKVALCGSNYAVVENADRLKPGDGVVFDDGGDTDHEQGGRIYEVRERRVFFKHNQIDFSRIHPGVRVWKTDDPALNRSLQKSYAKDPELPSKDVGVGIRGQVGEPLEVTFSFEKHNVKVVSSIPLELARKRPFTKQFLQQQFGRLGNTCYQLANLEVALEGDVILPLSELSRMRREAVEKLDFLVEDALPVVEEKVISPHGDLSVADLLPECRSAPAEDACAQLIVTCRTLEQIDVALDCGVRELYVDFEDIRRYKDAVEKVRCISDATILLATPRIQKAGEQGIFKHIEKCDADGVLIRNLGALHFFRQSWLRKVGDFSLNVANPLTAQFLMGLDLERLTISYDLTISQVVDLLHLAPAEWFELTIHQHMPMFHMEHCVFAAFLSKGVDHTDCGRPCDRHTIELRDRVGAVHPVKADVGCRNTVFNARAQTGAEFFEDLMAAGLRRYRVELLAEDGGAARRVIEAYQSMVRGETEGAVLWQQLKAQAQLGVTKGSYQ